mgnify:CR=1 FL=1
MTQHLHTEFVEGCYRCDLSRDEAERYEPNQQDHAYTVDVYLDGAEPYPCIICGEGRRAHERFMDALNEERRRNLQ